MYNTWCEESQDRLLAQDVAKVNAICGPGFLYLGILHTRLCYTRPHQTGMITDVVGDMLFTFRKQENGRLSFIGLGQTLAI